MRHQAVIARPPRPPFAKRLCVYLWLRTAVPCASSSRSTSHVRSTGKQRAAAVQHEDTACTIDALQPPWAMPMTPAATPSPQASATKVAHSHPRRAGWGCAHVTVVGCRTPCIAHRLAKYYRTSLFDHCKRFVCHFVQFRTATLSGEGFVEFPRRARYPSSIRAGVCGRVASGRAT
jgi:hypothetical protein